MMLSIFSCVCWPSVLSSLEKSLFTSSAQFWIGLFVFLILSCMSCLYILEINPLSIALFATHMLFFFNINLFILFIYFLLHWVFIAARGLSLVAVSGGYSSLRCAGFSLTWLLLLWSTGSRLVGFSSCGTWAQSLWLAGSRAQTQ